MALRSIVFLGLFILSVSCNAQKSIEPESNSELSKAFFQRWQLDHGTANGEEIKGLPKPPNNDYEFKEDGSYLLYNIDGTYMVGTWSYNKEEGIVYTKRADGAVNGKIADIKSNSLTLIPAGEGIQGTPFENFRFYYKPINE